MAHLSTHVVAGCTTDLGNDGNDPRLGMTLGLPKNMVPWEFMIILASYLPSSQACRFSSGQTPLAGKPCVCVYIYIHHVSLSPSVHLGANWWAPASISTLCDPHWCKMPPKKRNKTHKSCLKLSYMLMTYNIIQCNILIISDQSPIIYVPDGTEMPIPCFEDEIGNANPPEASETEWS